VADTARGSAATQRCVERLQKSTEKKLKKFNKRAYQILHLGKNKPMLVADHLENSLA